MKNYYWESIAQDCIGKWKGIVLFTVVIAAVFGILGYRQSTVIVNLSEEQQEEITAYEEQLAIYDEEIAAITESIETAQTEEQSLQDYVDNALYMQLDGQDIKATTVEYAVTDTANTGNVLAAFTSWLGNGSSQEALAAEYGDTEAGYLREMLSWSTNGNLLDITLYHFDADEGKAAMETLKAGLEAYVSTVQEVQGAFTLTEVKTNYYVKVDTNVTTTQNGKLDSLKSYQSAQADYNSRLASYRSARESYVESDTPETMEAAAAGKTLVVKYVLFGVILALVLVFVVYTLRYLFSDRIRSARELARSGLPVFGTYGKESGFLPALEQGVLDVCLLAEHAQTKQLCLNVLSSDEALLEAVNALRGALTKKELVCGVRMAEENEADTLSQMVKTGYCLLAVKAGKNTYPQLREQLDLCKKYQVEVFGCIVAE